MNTLSDETKSKLIKLKENLTETKDLITPELIHDTIKLLDVDNDRLSLHYLLVDVRFWIQIIEQVLTEKHFEDSDGKF